MRFRRIICGLLALTVCIPLSGCDLSDPAETSDTVSDQKDNRFNTAELKDKASALQEIWSNPDSAAEAELLIKDMLDAVNEAYAINMRAQIAYYADWNDPELSQFYHDTTADYYIAESIAQWAFANGCQRSAYPDIFAAYADTQNLEYYSINSLTRAIADARNDAAGQSKLLEDYYSIAYDENIDLDETNAKCAEIYLNLLGDYDVSEALYDYYDRDYTAEEASEVFRIVTEKFVPLRDALKEQLGGDSAEILSKSVDIDPYAELKKYAPRLSENVAESVTKLFSESLYTEAVGVNCYDGSFTVNLPGEQTALMYTYLNDDYLDFITVTHEFGHFHSDWRDTTPVCLQSMNLDIAEAQSQSMVTMFLPYYPDIFGSDSELYQQAVLFDLLDSLIAGFAVGEFEYTVTQRLDDISPDETTALFDEIMESCGQDLELYQITHLFEQPGYYVSYGVSALPALEMYTMVNEDFGNAASVYDKLSSYSCMSGEYHFRDIMQECGLSDFFDPDALDALAETISAQIGAVTIEQ